MIFVGIFAGLLLIGLTFQARAVGRYFQATEDDAVPRWVNDGYWINGGRR